MNKLIFLMLLLVLIPHCVADKFDHLQFDHNEIGFNRACTYYYLNNPNVLNIPEDKLDSLKLHSWKKIHGDIIDPRWEWEVVTKYQIDVPVYKNKVKKYECFNNKTQQKETCKRTVSVFSHNETVDKVRIEYKEFGKQGYSAKDVEIKHTGKQKVRFCADIERVYVKGRGYTIEIDHIPVYDSMVYDSYTWWNNSYEARHLVTLNSSISVINQPYCLNISYINHSTTYIALLRNDSGTFNLETWDFRKTRDGLAGSMRLDNDTICWRVNLTADISKNWYIYKSTTAVVEYNSPWYIWHDCFEGDDGSVTGWFNSSTAGFGITGGLNGNQAVTLTSQVANQGAYVQFPSTDSGDMYVGFLARWGINGGHIWVDNTGQAGHAITDSVHMEGVSTSGVLQSYYSGDYHTFASMTINTTYGILTQINSLGANYLYNISVNGGLSLTTQTGGSETAISYIELYYGTATYDDFWVTNGIPIMMYAIYPTGVIGAEETLDSIPPTISAEAITDTEIYVNGTVKLNCTVLDDTAVDLVRFFIEPFGNLPASNISSEYYLICNATNPCNTTQLGQYNWSSVWVNDTSNNINSTIISLNYSIILPPPSVYPINFWVFDVLDSPISDVSFTIYTASTNVSLWSNLSDASGYTLYPNSVSEELHIYLDFPAYSAVLSNVSGDPVVHLNDWVSGRVRLSNSVGAFLEDQDCSVVVYMSNSSILVHNYDTRCLAGPSFVDRHGDWVSIGDCSLTDSGGWYYFKGRVDESMGFVYDESYDLVFTCNGQTANFSFTTSFEKTPLDMRKTEDFIRNYGGLFVVYGVFGFLCLLTLSLIILIFLLSKKI